MKLDKSSPPPLGRERRDRPPLKVGWERFSAVARELSFLSARQQAEVGEDFEPYAPDWDTYFSYDRAGSCAVWTARTVPNGVLVGYIIWLTTRGLHCADTTFANADLVYLAPDYREGLTGYKLLRGGIAAIKPHVDLVRIETNLLYEQGRMGILLKRLGFRHIGEVWQGDGRQ